jgi:MHS family proline/betaine transporter-like MFS transporter
MAPTAMFRAGTHMEQPETIARESEQIQQAAARDARRRALVAGCVGNLVEWADFALYGAFATLLAAVFFPGADPVSGLLPAFAVFGVAFVARPAGALLFAHYGDRHGRRRALAASILLMAIATAAIGLLPGHGSIGWLAPALLVLLRAGQGVAVGGEYGGSAALVVEYAPAGRRGWYGGWQWATVALGLGAGIATAALLSATLEASALRAWGWRLAFLLALPLGLVGLYIRLQVEETPGFRAVQRLGAAARTPLAEVLRSARRAVLVGFGMVAAVTATFNIVFVFLPSHLAATGRAPLPRALTAALVGLLVAAGTAPLAGRLSDRVGRRPLLVAGVIALLVLTVPVTALILRGEPGGLLVGYPLIGLALGALVPSTFLAELFPTRLRYSGLSLSYGLASAFFGGTAPAVATFLVRRTGAALAPAWYATGLTVVAGACALLAPETAGRPLDAGGDRASGPSG